MVLIRRFVGWVLAVAVMGACALLVPAESVTSVGSVQQRGDETLNPPPGCGSSFNVVTTVSFNVVTTVDVPDLVGLGKPEATQKLTDVGLVLGTVSGTGDTVQSQDPDEGKAVPPGFAVNVDMGTAPAPRVYVPTLWGWESRRRRRS